MIIAVFMDIVLLSGRNRPTSEVCQDDGSSNPLRNVGQFLRQYTEQHSRRQ
jgi:hypothetical protein